MFTHLSSLDLVELQNLYFKENRDFLDALDNESSELLQIRRERIRIIDEEIEKRKTEKKIS